MPSGKSIKALIVDGKNNHDWKRTTSSVTTVLLASGLFTVDVSTAPADGSESERNAWNPDFASYDVVIQNFNGGPVPAGDHWPRAIQESLESYVKDGGGLVVFHAANNAFHDWPAYNEMIGLGWRDVNFGASYIIDENKNLVKHAPGEGLGPGHGPDHEFVVQVFNPEHPICNGLPDRWLHSSDQLSHGQRGPAKNMEILTYAYSRDSKQNEVLEWVVPFGKGRVFTTMLGHIWSGAANISVRCAGFQTTFIRGVEWAATGAVTYPVPEQFPSPDAILLTETPAEEKAWRLDMLDAHSFAYWTSRSGGAHQWSQVGEAGLEPADDTRIAVSEGRGTFYNGPNGNTSDIYTVWECGDCKLHIEFMMPKGSNSGVYFMGRYEVQILDSWGETDLKFGTCGGIYSRWINETNVGGTPPRVNAGKPPGEWQIYDIEFSAPRFHEHGKKAKNACFKKVVWNGQVVHENVEVVGPTRGAMLENESAIGPLMLQGDHGPVAFRNIIWEPVWNDQE